MADAKTSNIKPSGSLVDNLLQVNKLLYKMPPELSVARFKRPQIDYWAQSTYNSGETMVLEVQTGQMFVDPQESYLRFELTTTPTGGMVHDFVTGSGANVFSRIVVRTRSGREWCRLEDANLLTKYLDRYNRSQDWFDSVGQAQGYASAAGNNRGFGNGPAQADAVYVIPMCVIPCFNRTDLLPPQLMSGLRIEITLAGPNAAFGSNAVGGNTLTYTLSQPEVHWMCYSLDDVYQRKIQEISAQRGLTLLHKEWFHTIVSGTGTQYNYDIKKSATKATRCLIMTRLSANVNSLTFDSMSTESYDYSNYQAHIGAVYYPNAPLDVKGVTLTQYADSYYHTLNSFGKDRKGHSPPAASLTTFGSTNVLAGAAAAYNNDGMIAFNLNKSQVSTNDGAVVNNSRSLLIDIEFANGATRRLDSYLEFVRAAKIYPNNAVISD